MPEKKPKKTSIKKKTVTKKTTAVKSVKKITDSKRKSPVKKITKRTVSAKKRKIDEKPSSQKPTKTLDEKFAKQYPIMGASFLESTNTPIEGSATMQRRQFKKKDAWHKRTYHPLGEHPHLPHHHSFSLLAILALVCSAIFLYFGLQPAFNFDIPEVKMQREYHSETHNFSLERPGTWKVSEFVVGNGEDKLESVVLQNGAQSIVIYTTREPNEEETLIPGSFYTDEINGTQVTRYRDYDPDTGLLLERVVVKRSNGLVHELRGYGPLFERVVDSFVLDNN